MIDDSRVEQTVHSFCRIYLGGIHPIITDDSAFLSFLCVLSATEALAGYRYPDQPDSASRFNEFVSAYFPPEYSPYADGRFWIFRCRMFHAFSPVGFSLIHHRSDLHFALGTNGQPVLNAEDFYSALVFASQRYFAELRKDTVLQAALLRRLDHPTGGSVTVGAVQVNRYMGGNLTST